jgi:hypothetical protein
MMANLSTAVFDHHSRNSGIRVATSVTVVDSIMNVRFPHAAGLILLLALTGCGNSGPQIAPVHGRVTLDGRPLENANVEFKPKDSPRPSTGLTNADGQYELAYKRGQLGAVVGLNSVRITVSSELVKNPPKIAARFNSQSELEREVKPGDNPFDFDVTTEEK